MPLEEARRRAQAKHIAKQIDSLGASTFRLSGVWFRFRPSVASGLSDTFEQWFAPAMDVLPPSSFPSQIDWNQIQGGVRSLRHAATLPALNFLANQTLKSRVVRRIPAAVVSAPHRSRLDSPDSTMLADWHEETYAPQNTILAISGDVHAKSLIPKPCRNG